MDKMSMFGEGTILPDVDLVDFTIDDLWALYHENIFSSSEIFIKFAIFISEPMQLNSESDLVPLRRC